MVRKATLSIGKNELTIRSGQYEIVLPKDYESLKVDDRSIQLKRGGNEYVSITHIERGVPDNIATGTLNPPGMVASGPPAMVEPTSVTVPVELSGETLMALPGDKTHVYVVQSARTIAENLQITGMDKVEKVGSDVIHCEMTFEVTPIIAARLRAAVSLGTLSLTLQSKVDLDQGAGARIPKGMRVVSIDVDQPVGSSHILTPGDRVDLLVVFSQRTELAQVKSVRTVVEAVEVFAVDQHGMIEEELFPPRRISLLVDTKDVTRITLAKDVGRLTVALRSKKDDSRTPAEELFSAAMLKEMGIRIALVGSNPYAGTPEPVFSGKTFDQWLREVRTERNPDELEQAVKALCILGRGYRDREAAEAVLQILEPYPLDSLPRRATTSILTGERRLVASAIRQLRRLRAEDILEPVVAALRKDSVLLRRLIIEWLAEPPHGVHQSLSGSIMGAPDPLREILLSSPDYIDTVLELWDELAEPSQHSAFLGLSDRVRGPQTEPKLVERLEELVRTPTSPFHMKAARLIVEIKPRPELAGLFLTALEDPQRVSSFSRHAWWTNELDAWIGLARLNERAAAAAERIAALLESSRKQNRLDQKAFLTLPSPVHRGLFRVPISRRLLIYELLGRLGPGVPATVRQAIVASMGDHFSAAPDFDGDFGFEATRPKFVLDHRELTSRLPEKSVVSGDVIEPGIQAELTASTLNAAVLALQRITGAPVPYLEASRVEGVGGSEGLPANFVGSVAPGAAGEQNTASFLPTLVTYRGKRFEEWCAAAEILDDTPSEQLESMRGGVTVLRESGAGGQIAITAIARVLDHLLATKKFYVDGQPNTVPAGLALAAYDALRTGDPDAAIQAAVTTLQRGSDQARWWVVDRLAHTRTETGHSSWSYPSELSDSVNRSTDFTVAFFEQFEKREWIGHGAGLKRALLRLAWRFVTTDVRAKQLSLDSYMQGLLDDDDPFVRAEAAVILSRLPLTSNQAVDDELRARLVDVLMSAIEQTPEGVELTDLVVALFEMSEELQDSSLERIVALIQKDSADKKGPRPILLQLMSYSPRSPGRDFGASDYAEAENTAGPGGVAGIPGVAPNWPLVTSRRLLLLYTLKAKLTAKSPSGADVKIEIAEALAKLVPLPVRSFSESQGPLKDLRSRWIDGHRVIGSQPADAASEAVLFTETAVDVARKWLPAERARELLFPEDATNGE